MMKVSFRNGEVNEVPVNDVILVHGKLGPISLPGITSKNFFELFVNYVKRYRAETEQLAQKGFNSQLTVLWEIELWEREFMDGIANVSELRRWSEVARITDQVRLLSLCRLRAYELGGGFGDSSDDGDSSDSSSGGDGGSDDGVGDESDSTNDRGSGGSGDGIDYYDWNDEYGGGGDEDDEDDDGYNGYNSDGFSSEYIYDSYSDDDGPVDDDDDEDVSVDYGDEADDEDDDDDVEGDLAKEDDDGGADSEDYSGNSSDSGNAGGLLWDVT